MTEQELNKLKCVHLEHRIREMASVFIDDFEGVVGKLVEEGKRIGKTPWCADIHCEMEARRRLNQLGNYPQEEMQQTVERRKTQPHMMIDIYGCIIQ